MTTDERERLVHELRNQLAIVLGFADCLFADLSGEDPRLDDVREIRGAAESAAALLDRLEPVAGSEGAGR